MYVKPKHWRSEQKTTAHSFVFNAIDGPTISLRLYAGKPILIVNTASECGFATQSGALQELWDRYRKQGLVVIGVPSNDFGEQEPGSNAAIQSLCTKYGITFPMTEKSVLVGEDAHPFYRWVVTELGEGAAPTWNFHKYLIDGAGNFAGLWPPQTNPLDNDVVTAIEGLLPRQ
jgi:glutathione peroxidase